MHFNAVVCCRLIRQRGQTHTELFYVGAAGRRNGLCERRGTHVLALKHAAPRLRGLRLGLQTRRGFKSFHCPRWRIKFSLERFSDPSRICLRAQPLESSLGRVPQAADSACNKIS